MNDNRFAAIILAAGLSTRMKEFKPLLPLGNATVIEHAISSLKSTGIDVLLVTGHRQEELKAVVKRYKVTTVYNPDYEKGMFTSVQAGVQKLGKRYQAFFLLPADIPMVKSATIQQIMASAENAPDRIIYPVYNGKRGHPPLIPASMAPGILTWKQEGGLKTFLRSHDEMAENLAVDDSFILFDIDTPEDYQRLLEYHRDSITTS